MIVHGYLGTDLDAIWLMVAQDLPPLTEALNRMLSRLSPDIPRV